jgi:N-carbamoyl-D-amino-acid hydrolase
MPEQGRLRLAAAQLGPIPAASPRSDTVERLLVLLRRAADQGCELVVFPELALTPFFPRTPGTPDEVLELFDETMPNPSVQPLFDDAKRLGLGFCLGYAEADHDGPATRYYNSAVLVGPDGAVLGKYRKIHIPGLAEAPADAERRFEGKNANFEKRYFSKGNLGFPTSQYQGVRVGMAICNDRRWPETYRMLALNGAQLVVIGYNTMARRRLTSGAVSIAEPGHLASFHNHLVMQAGAYQNAVWVVAAARAGEEEGGHLIGGSCVIAPTGEIVAQAYTLDDELVTGEADFTYCRLYMDSVWNFDRERQIEDYGLITSTAGWQP